MKTKEKANRTISLENELEDFIKYIGLKEKIAEFEIFKLWRECVGNTISEYSSPVGIKKNKILIKVENAVWRYELSLKKAEILKKLNSNEILKKEKKVIKDIIFV
ncbi:MAG: DUF721 domain-containing protein [Ignavibacteria bacterium]|nr:DUF721 domain-containing protein [Ignavibacteria bacterium]